MFIYGEQAAKEPANDDMEVRPRQDDSCQERNVCGGDSLHDVRELSSYGYRPNVLMVLLMNAAIKVGAVQKTMPPVKHEAIHNVK